MNQTELKQLVAQTAINRLIEQGKIFSGMNIGLGTGSTALPAIMHLARYLKEGKISSIKAVATSFQTVIACENEGIPVYSLNAKVIAGKLDLAIDGADEISPEKYLVKGGGAALLLEKIIAYNADHFVIIADESKLVSHVGTGFPLPIEVIPEARVAVTRELEKRGIKVMLREGIKKAGPVITDNGNIILDILWDKPVQPCEWEAILNRITGVVENGFFTERIPTVFIAHKDGSIEER